MIRVYFWIFSVLFSFYTFQIFSQSPDSVSLEIKSNKNIYFENETVFISIKAKNIGNSNDSLPLFNEYNILEQMDIKDNLGNKLYFKSPGEPTYMGQFGTVIAPGTDICVDININNYFGNVLIKGGIYNPFYYFSNGIYNIQCNFKNFQNNQLSSNNITIKIISPEGKEINYFENLKNIYQLPENNYKDKQNKFDVYRDLFFKEKDSVYNEDVFSQMLSLYFIAKVNDQMDILDDISYFINNYPNSMYIKDVIMDYVSIINNTTNNTKKLNMFLNEIINKYPNTRAFNEAKKLIK